jgi:hypothetical protein
MASLITSDAKWEGVKLAVEIGNGNKEVYREATSSTFK